jgi:hypothetical protein
VGAGEILEVISEHEVYRCAGGSADYRYSLRRNLFGYCDSKSRRNLGHKSYEGRGSLTDHASLGYELSCFQKGTRHRTRVLMECRADGSLQIIIPLLVVRREKGRDFARPGARWPNNHEQTALPVVAPSTLRSHYCF